MLVMEVVAVLVSEGRDRPGSAGVDVASGVQALLLGMGCCSLGTWQLHCHWPWQEMGETSGAVLDLSVVPFCPRL